MGDASKFAAFFEYQAFEGALCFLFLSEFFIWLFTSSRWARKGERGGGDATMWLVVLAWCGSLWLGFYFRSEDVEEPVRNLLLPRGFFYLGLVLLIGGTVLRDLSVWTLKRAFTLNVQTTEDQHLIRSGPYRTVRNPAYTGSILSLLGTAFCLRSAYSPIPVLVLCLLCYGIRIRKEEKILAKQFGEEFEEYRGGTWRLLPHIW